MANKLRVMLVDDHKQVRSGVSTLLGNYEDIEIVGEASDGEEAVQLTRKLRPDVILMDIRMPKMNGLEATSVISSEFPDISIIGLSMYDENGNERAMLAAGAAAHLAKDGSSKLLLATIRDHGGRKQRRE